ncbi:hypothetical protein E2C01_002812 [Portunus trituberculatus]|uniref:Uncharacterized protein n=1 Tax=Portunus trituberculatus TaxID=210409 RepID=A0A5B7CKG3_PORTR|nr:hypothetical protein [Portunus trituberculatus]
MRSSTTITTTTNTTLNNNSNDKGCYFSQKHDVIGDLRSPVAAARHIVALLLHSPLHYFNFSVGREGPGRKDCRKKCAKER